MKRLINIGLLIGSTVALVLVLKLSAIPVLKFLPQGIKSFFVTDIKTQQEYILIYDLGIGFILSTMFYFIVDMIPEYAKVQRAKKILGKEISLLLQAMEEIISIVISNYDCSKDLYSLTEKDFLILNGNISTTEEKFSYRIGIYDKDGIRKTGFHLSGTIQDIVKKNINKILKQVNYIKEYEYLYTICIDFMENIRNIERCRLVRYYQEDVKCFKYGDTNLMMIEFVQLYLKLKQFKFHSQNSITSLDTKEESKEFLEDLENGKTLKEFGKELLEDIKKYQENPTLVVGGGNYASRIVFAEMKKHLKVDYTTLDTSPETFTNYKYIVFIVDETSWKDIKMLLKNIDVSAKIILLSQKTFVSGSYIAKLNHSQINIKKELYFQAIQRIGKTRFYIAKKEPSEKTIMQLAEQVKEFIFEN